MSEKNYARLAVIHNAMAPKIVRDVIRPTIEAGGDYTDVLVVLESVIVGTVLTATKLGGDETIIHTLFEGVRQRLAEARLAPIKTEGTA